MGEKFLLKKALIIFTIFTIFLLAFSAVSAADNDAAANPDDNILSADNAATETAKIEVELTADEQYGIYGNKDTKLTVQASDKDGNKVNGGSVIFVDVFGKNYTADMVDGIAKSNVYVGDTGKFNITCLYIGAEGYSNANGTLPLIVPVANTSCVNIIASKYDEAVYFTGNVRSDYRQYSEYDDYEEVTRGHVTVYVDGEKLGTCDLDVNGNFVYIWKTTRNLIGQTINFTGVYSDDDKHFNPSTFSKLFIYSSNVNSPLSLTISNSSSPYIPKRLTISINNSSQGASQKDITLLSFQNLPIPYDLS